MMYLLITLMDDTDETSKAVEQTLADYYPIVNYEKKSPDAAHSLVTLAATYIWTDKDRIFMDHLVEKDLIARWAVQIQKERNDRSGSEE